MKKLYLFSLMLLIMLFSFNLNAASLQDNTSIIMTSSSAEYLNYSLEITGELKDGEGVFNGQFFIYTKIYNPTQTEIDVMTNYDDMINHFINTPYDELSIWKDKEYPDSWINPNLVYPYDYIEEEIIHAPYFNLIVYYIDDIYLPQQFIVNNIFTPPLGKVYINNGYWGYNQLNYAYGYLDEDCTDKVLIQDCTGYFEEVTDEKYKFIATIKNGYYLENFETYYVLTADLPIYDVDGATKYPYEFEYFSVYKNQWCESKVEINTETIEIEYYATIMYIASSSDALIGGLATALDYTYPVFYLNITDLKGNEIPIDQIIYISFNYQMYYYKYFFGIKTGTVYFDRHCIVYNTMEIPQLNIKGNIFIPGGLSFNYENVDCIQKGPFICSTSLGEDTFSWKIISNETIPGEYPYYATNYTHDFYTCDLKYSYLDTTYIYNDEYIFDSVSPIQPEEPVEEETLIGKIFDFVKSFGFIVLGIAIVYLAIKLFIQYKNGKRR